MYNRKLNENYLSTIIRLYENLKPKTSELPDPDSLAEEIKRVHLQCYILLNAPKASLLALNIDC